MNHRVPDLDVGSSDFNYVHSLYLSSGKGAAAPPSAPPLCDQREENFSTNKKNAGICVPDNQVSWTETEAELKGTQVFAAGRESVLAMDVPLDHLPFQDDEMLSWLQYPLDDTFSRSYCTEQLCDQPLLSYPVQVPISASISMDIQKPSSSSFSSQLLKPSDSNMGVQRLTADVAMATGAQRAAGLLPQAGAEAFNRVHTTRTSSHDAYPSEASDMMHTPCNVVENHVGKQNARNFSFFSQHVAAVKTNLQICGTSCGPANKERLKQPLSAQGSKISSTVDQSMGTASLASSNPLGGSYLTKQGKELMQGNDTIVQICDTSSGPANKERLKQTLSAQASKVSSTVEQSTGMASLASSSPLGESYLTKQGKEMMQGNNTIVQRKFLDSLQCMDKAGKAKIEIDARGAAVGSEMGDITLTSLSDGSGYSTEKSARDMVDLSCKRKLLPAEDSECDSKDARGVISQEKGLMLNKSTPAKRTRAAEIHNQSERRRRNKINEKMRALQELIPNANKTDKASMLDEAIEYVKMLQAQIQFMSVRTGMIVPPVMMPPGMQYLSVKQRQGSPQVNMGMGLNTGHVMDASGSSAVGALPRPAFLGQPIYHLAGYQPHGSPSVVQNSVTLNNRNAMSAFQHVQPLHSPRVANTCKLHMEVKPELRKQK